jgi:dephospho-CoA kinase
MKVAITGGIGSGKSYVCKLLQQRGINIYDCDQAAKRLIRTSPDIRRQLSMLIGPEAYWGEDGQGGWILNKAVVAQFLLGSEANAHAIDDIVHPAVFHDFETSGMQWLESAILYESGMDKLVNRVIVVTAPQEVRIQRVMQRDGISREKVLEWMSRQWSQDEIRQRADYEIINDGQADLNEQIEQLLTSLDISK